eukprot:CAMPEP_0178910242 /NCGR_PEP_ID=MMETSP0786-20121207/8988_1 /TAXON_ID=186022 /ORGANISM="Thalassionema frauenfeldii, Strain CCMP 1798" /LENGTH=487 /DNA_ID=CAMNT_0020582471 /DNA_START=195 /DNA_END=1658 /DNA_ORIENTATION=+
MTWIQHRKKENPKVEEVVLTREQQQLQQQMLQKREDLEVLVEKSIKEYLVKTYPKAFLTHRPHQKKIKTSETKRDDASSRRRIRTLADLQLVLRQNQNSSTNKDDEDYRNKKSPKNLISDQLQTLVELNGFDRVSLPDVTDSIRLAEGVMAEPIFYHSRLLDERQQQFVLFSQVMDKYSQPQNDKKKNKEKKKNKALPKFVGDDIKIYRRLEKQVDQFLQVRYNEVKYRYNVLKAKYHEIEEWIDKNIIKKKPDACHLRNKLVQEVETSQLSPPVILSKNKNTLENLLVLSNCGDDDDEHDLLLISHMEPSRRLLALPHRLKLNPASTIISVSLVVFGALPLAYRSINFAMEYYSYPFLSEAMALSVAGTVGYGIWSSRDASRTRQAQAVGNAMNHRIYARGEAVLWVLQEGAVRRLAKAVLALYYHHSNNENGNTAFIVDQQGPIDLPQIGDNPLDVAIELGLFERTSSGDYSCVDIDKVSSLLKS